MEKKCGGTIYGIKDDDKFYYIGKTNNKNHRNKINKNEKELRISDANYQYHNTKLRNFIINTNDIKIITIKEVNVDEWYDEKLYEVIQKHKANHPLLNADWMKEGKRGYWQDKKRDKNTLSRLSKSKYKKIIQYDEQGYLIKIWNSGKEIGIKIFKDYRVVNGCARSKIYEIIDRKLYNRCFKKSYWFKYNEILENFSGILSKINLIEFHNKLKIEKKKLINKRKFLSTYTVIEYINNKPIKTFNDVWDAANNFNVSETYIRKICRGLSKPPNNHIFKYGKKTLKPNI